MNIMMMLAEAAPIANSGLDRLHAMQEGVRSEPTLSPFLWLAGGVLVVALLLLAARRFFDQERSANQDAQVDYLAVAADTLGLSAADRRVLSQLAERSHAVEPAAMLLTPRNLAAALERATSDARDPDLRAQIDGICQRLFGIELP